EVQGGAGLAQPRRGEVHGDPPRWMAEPRVPDGPADALAGLLEGRVREADDREPWQARGDVDLDPDDPAVDADDRRGKQGGQHGPTLAAGGHPPRHRALTPPHPLPP